MFHIETYCNLKYNLLGDYMNILFAIPYKKMQGEIEKLQIEFPNLKIDVFLADTPNRSLLDKHIKSHHYDLILSRGGLFNYIKNKVYIPTIEIEVSVYDILNIIDLKETNKQALIGFANITKTAQNLCSLTPLEFSIHTLNNHDEIPFFFETLNKYKKIYSDGNTYKILKENNYPVYLIESSYYSIKEGLINGLKFISMLKRQNFQEKIWESVLKKEETNIYIYKNNKPILSSSIDTEYKYIIEEFINRKIKFLTSNKNLSLFETVNTKTLNFSTKKITFKEEIYTVIKVKILNNNKNFTYDYQSNHSYTLDGNITSSIIAYSKSKSPVIIQGEHGTGKDEIAHRMYKNSVFSNSSFITIDLKGISISKFHHLLKDEESILNFENNVIYFKNLEYLTPEQNSELFYFINNSSVNSFNKIILSTNKDYYGSKYLKINTTPLRLNPNFKDIILNKTNNLIISDEQINQLLDFKYPNNEQQLNTIIEKFKLNPNLDIILKEEIYSSITLEVLDLNQNLDQIMYQVCLLKLKENNYNLSKTAIDLNIGRTTLWRMLKRT